MSRHNAEKLFHALVYSCRSCCDALAFQTATTKLLKESEQQPTCEDVQHQSRKRQLTYYESMIFFIYTLVFESFDGLFF